MSVPLEQLIREYAHDLRRNSSGGDNYPWEWARGVADYLEELIRRSNMLHRDQEIERIIRLVHDMADDHVLRECVGKALDTAYREGYKQRDEDQAEVQKRAAEG